ncbi:hypothetical protein M9H77_16399 [Catharanthus roseus]|uniref:Uncharacterized protein n=1 Tax=Catharanthus roseus TaxID=4058 RepID=A0ACC0B1N6_CATRO|nr:hypothetical protein M9H77_16399 [Catharanthus roseus]
MRSRIVSLKQIATETLTLKINNTCLMISTPYQPDLCSCCLVNTSEFLRPRCTCAWTSSIYIASQSLRIKCKKIKKIKDNKKYTEGRNKLKSNVVTRWSFLCHSPSQNPEIFILHESFMFGNIAKKKKNEKKRRKEVEEQEKKRRKAKRRNSGEEGGREEAATDFWRTRK